MKWFNNPFFWEKLNEREIRFPCVVHLKDCIVTWIQVMVGNQNSKLFWYKINQGTFKNPRDMYRFVACNIAQSE